MRVLRVCGGISLFLQAIYLLADWDCGVPHYQAIVALHVLNLLDSLVFLGLTYVRPCRDHLAPAVLAGASIIFAATAALSLLTLNHEALTITASVMMVSLAALMPWNWRWQAGLAIAAAASMAGAALICPAAYPHIRYDWLAIAAAAGAAHYVALSGQRYRCEIASRILALQVNHSLLSAESAAREAAAAANEEVHRQLRESEAKLRKIFETSTDMITISRLSDGCYLDLNESFSTATGYSREEALGHTAGERGLFADRAQLLRTLRLIKTEGRVTNLEADILTKSGSVRPYLISATVTDLGGEPCIIAISRDITTIKQTECELIAAREAALAASKAKSEFLSSMSHEIRTPMNAILGMAQLLHETPLNPEQKNYLEIMTSSGDALLELINGILDLAKIESGRLDLEQASFDLETLIDRTIETLSVRARQKGLELLARVMPDVPRQLVGDRLRLGQVLLNLLGNAIKFTAKGEILLTVECDRASANPADLHFSVADTGIGIAGDKLEEVFANFTQADSSTSRNYGGSGLGLAIVRRLVTLMSGRVWVESELGRGSVFHFTAHFEVQADAASERRSPVMLNGLRALVVDGNSISRLILAEILASRGAEIDQAEDGLAALQLIERSRTGGAPYKLMLIDCRMPGMDGFEVAKRVKKVEAEVDLTVLMMSSDDFTPLQLAHARELGIAACLVKPLRRAELFDAIDTALASPTERSDAGGPAVQRPTLIAAKRGRAADAPADIPLKILLADDSKDNRLLIHAYLKDSGYRLDESENGAIAVGKLKAGHYDLILMDIQMPVMDGLEATRAIRNWERERGRPRTPILALTASALEEDVRRALEAGADMHISKPIRKDVLKAAIRASTSPGADLTTLQNPNDAAA